VQHTILEHALMATYYTVCMIFSCNFSHSFRRVSENFHELNIVVIIVIKINLILLSLVIVLVSIDYKTLILPSSTLYHCNVLSV